ncbi:methyltransferase [Motiliproteus sp. MSK22-1]|uniref:class I SAM-dependent methyltransferase n=1 Tax=Motiliproteus sp. MSK22-1 TaxID=1897630 RepID=UPI00097887B6|nr:methyltransferase domain-containing protein [Motiliproteus sp. MSK22-1]OMH25733.1 histidine kinase [Motiliproteus sp. MSK22-1]
MTLPVRVRYQTVEFGSTDIHLCTLRDNQQFSDPDGIAQNLGISSATWPLFGVIWPSGFVLAHYLSDYQTDRKRILEIGCGMALSSLLLNKQNADITATDYHPEVGFFLQRNTKLNNGKVIEFERVDWADKTDKLGRFDLIVGSDLLYEDQHIQLLADFIENHANPACEVILVDPGRGRKNKFSLQMEKYGYSNAHIKPTHTNYLELPFKGFILKFQRD